MFGSKLYISAFLLANALAALASFWKLRTDSTPRHSVLISRNCPPTLVSTSTTIVASLTMPTTRSQGRHEPLQRLETPPKRQRKQKSRRPAMAHTNPEEPRMRTLSMSPEPEPLPEPGNQVATISSSRPSYSDASTQTEDVIFLTMAEVAELRDRATASMSHKRNRDAESDDEPIAKRHQFSTPQETKPNNLWMFGEKPNGDHPRTAPSKTLAGTPLRRPLKGPMSRRINPTDSPRFRVKNNSPRPAVFDSIKPIEPEMEKQDDEVQEAASQEQESNSGTQSHSQSQAPQTPRRGLFGSLRGIVHKGWDIAASFSPLTKGEPRPVVQDTTNDVSYPQLHVEDEGVSMEGYDSEQERQHRSAERLRPQQSSQYDHLHYIPADTESVDKAINGEIEPPHQAPTPLSPASRLKAQNPQLSDATIDSILKKRERKAALEEERYGPRPIAAESNVAPLFGPDSHYARGTVDPRFLPATPLFGPSKKRKIESVEQPKVQHSGFGFDEEEFDNIEDDHVDQSAEVEQDDIDLPPAKRQKAQTPLFTRSTMPATPRSAMKKPGINGSIGRKSVAFGQSVSRDIRGHYGPAGQYKGSTFADETPNDSRSLSSIDQNDVISPTTRLNTINNSIRRPASALDNLGSSTPVIDFTLRDPNDAAWRPSLGNPRPGVFRVPDVDEEDPDETMSEDSLEQPQTPRMSHAELPGAPSPFGSTSFNESSIVHESTELALDKARSKAEKYKPKSSSRLSEVSRARSRSTSPNNEEDDEEEEERISNTRSGKTSGVTTPAVQPIGTPPQPFVPRSLNNTIKGIDGLTDHEREHQFDEWAANLDWDAPQTYEDAGTGSAFIHNLIRKNWTEEDDRRSESFWAREFDEVNTAMLDAMDRGQRLVLVTGMEDVESY